jgi:hypothetical protein
MEYVRPQRFESNYVAQIRKDGALAAGYRTYRIPAAGGRNIILLNSDYSWLFSSPAEKAMFDNFREALAGAADGPFLRAKGFVNAIYDGDIMLPRVSIFVHKHGLVPGFVLQERASSTFSQGVKEEFEIAIYPRTAGGRSTTGAGPARPAFMSSDFEFLKSLQVSLQTQMTRYLEDVGEDFVDIRENLSFGQVLSRAKAAESTIASSIKAKLQRLLPNNPNHAISLRKGRYETELQRLQHTVLLNNIGTVVWAQYARYYALYMLNELYILLGIGDRSDEYRDRPREFRHLLAALYDDPAWFEAQAESDPILKTLRVAWGAYYGDNLEQLLELRTEVTWLTQFVEFAVFLLRAKTLAKEEQLAPETGRIFLSHQHDVAGSELLSQKIFDWVDEEGRGRVRTLRYKGHAGSDIRAPIKTRIWAADDVISLVPRLHSRSEVREEKSFNWIILEAEHAKLLSKRLVFVVQSRNELDDLEGAIRRFEGTLLGSNTLLNAKERLEDVITAIQDNIFQKFEAGGAAELEADADLRKFITTRIDQLLRKRAMERVYGFLQLVPEDQRKCALRLHDVAPDPTAKSKASIAVALHSRWRDDYPTESRAERVFEATWEALRHPTDRSKKEGRHLVVGGKPVFLLRQVRNKEYASALFQMVKSSLPEASDAEIGECIETIKQRVYAPSHI